MGFELLRGLSAEEFTEEMITDDGAWLSKSHLESIEGALSELAELKVYVATFEPLIRAQKKALDERKKMIDAMGSGSSSSGTNLVVNGDVAENVERAESRCIGHAEADMRLAQMRAERERAKNYFDNIKNGN